MRWLVLLVLAACAEEGAHLTLSAPGGPAQAASFQIVLASPQMELAVHHQRVDTHSTGDETVTYYLQHAIASARADQSLDAIDGSTVLVEPDATIADRSFIPFMLLFDASQRLVAIGTFHATTGSSEPSPILVLSGEVDRYTLDVEPVTQLDDPESLDPQQAMVVACTRPDQSTWLSGIAWRQRAGGEIRLLLPEDTGSPDATGRTLDLDCDGHAVKPDDATADCDDTRARFHRGASEACDGEDTNCDQVPYLAVPCTASNVCSTNGTHTGIALCDDTTGTVGITCASDPACLCQVGGTGCTKCLMTYADGTMAGDVAPCQPGVGQLSTDQWCTAGPCTVDVIGVQGGWEAYVAPGAQGPFGVEATGVTSSVHLMAKNPISEIPGTGGQSVGSVELVIVDAAGTPHFLGVDLELGGDFTTCQGSSPYQMACSP